MIWMRWFQTTNATVASGQGLGVSDLRIQFTDEVEMIQGGSLVTHLAVSIGRVRTV